MILKDFSNNIYVTSYLYIKKKISNYDNYIFNFEHCNNKKEKKIISNLKLFSNKDNKIALLSYNKNLKKKIFLINIYLLKNKKIRKYSFKIKNPTQNTNIQKISSLEKFYPYMRHDSPFSYNNYSELQATPSLEVLDDIVVSINLFLIKNFEKKNINFLQTYFFLKYLTFKRYPEQRLINQIFYYPSNLYNRFKKNIFRVINVWFMIILIKFFPNQIYRFSTRNVFPNNNNKYKLKADKFYLPIKVDQTKKIFSKFKKNDEVNLIFRGDSLKKYKSKINLKIPSFIFGVLNELQIEKVKNELGDKFLNKAYFVYSNLIFLKRFSTQTKFKKIVYIDGGEKINNSKSYLKTLDKNFNFCTKNNYFYIRAFKNFFPKIPIGSDYLPTGSGLIGILSFLEEFKKINVYGWDFHYKKPLNSYKKISFFPSMFNYHLENRGHNNFESSLINIYYAHMLTKFKKVKIFSFLNNLEKFDSEIKKIGNILYKF